MAKKSEGGWSGIGMANSGIDPTHVYFLNDHPTQIPPSKILGPVVQNCQEHTRGNNVILHQHFPLNCQNRGPIAAIMKESWLIILARVFL